MVLHRMVVLKSEPAQRHLPDSVYLTPNGQRYESLLQLDFNSLVNGYFVMNFFLEFRDLKSFKNSF